MDDPPAYDDSAWFRRFRFSADDLPEVLADLAQLSSVLAGPRVAPRDELAARVELGSMLFPLGREDEAQATLVPAVALARELGDDPQLVAALLHLATTRQYLGRPEEALALFDEGLEHARATGTRGDEHYLLHHRGRCLAETGDAPAARRSFEDALVLRLELDDPWLVASTSTALQELDAWCAARPRPDRAR